MCFSFVYPSVYVGAAYGDHGRLSQVIPSSASISRLGVGMPRQIDIKDLLAPAHENGYVLLSTDF